MNFFGIIIEESLADKTVLKDLKIDKTEVEPATEKDATPWVKQWTMLMVEILENDIERFAQKISESIDPEHQNSWYADFRNDATHYIVFYKKVFKVDRTKKEQYGEVLRYGLSLGIPESQLDFQQ